MTKNDGIGNLHHGRFHVKGKQDIFIHGLVNLFREEGAKSGTAHDRSINLSPGEVSGFSFKKVFCLRMNRQIRW